MFTSIATAARPAPDTVFVYGYFGNGKDANGGLDSMTRAALEKAAFLTAATAALKRREATGEAAAIIEIFGGKDGTTRGLLVGLGEKDKFISSSLRTIIAAVGRRLAAIHAAAVHVCLSGSTGAAKADMFESGNAVGEGLGLLGWVCTEFRGSATPATKHHKLTISGDDESMIEGVDRGLALAYSANFARTLSQTPPNVATPEWMADQAAKMAKKAGLSFRVMKGSELVKERLEGLINVGKASENKPCMVRLEYTPKGGSKSKKPMVLIGKTMTYDSGGLSLKINNGMVGMKRDKDGGCAVLGAMHAIATVIKPRVRVVALLAIAENSVSDNAYRPDDVLRYRNNVTVEVTNTDAEGRLVLADALCWACEKENPSGIIDLATLTGGVVVALGSTFCGMFCEDDTLRSKVEAASAVAGERVWRLPMHAEYREMMKSPIADIVNSNPNRKASPIQGAAFLSYFVPEGVPWCHLDIAGVHAVEKTTGPFIEGPTGWGVRLLAELLAAE